MKGNDTTAIVISVVYRGCAIPVAWRIHHATQRGSWMDPIVELLRELAPAVPEEMTVIVLCDRGLASPKLWQQIRVAGLAPYMRYAKNVPSAPTAAGFPPAPSFPVPIPLGSAFQHPAATAPCWRSGTLSRRSLGSS